MTSEPTNPQFKEGSLEFELVKGLFGYMSLSMGDAAQDIYRTVGIKVQGEMRLNYRVEDIRLLADYIRDNKTTLDQLMGTVEYLPIAFYFDPR